jgi:hypothetical protein
MLNNIFPQFIIIPFYLRNRRDLREAFFTSIFCESFKLLHIFLSILLLFALLSCSNPNEVEKASITGKVLLVGDKDTPENELNDYSDVTISLYNLVVLDTNLVRLNREYPNIGVKISQETEFDFRVSEPVKTVKSDSKGYFKIDKVASREYNLVVSKPNWGPRVLYNVAVSKANNAELGEIGLYPVVELPMFISEPFVFKKDRTYIAKQDVTLGNSNVFEGNSQILLGPNCNLNFTTASTEGSIGYTRFDTLEKTGQQWGGLNFTKPDTHLSGLQIRNSLRGTVFLSGNSSLKNSIVEYTVDGSYLKGVNIALSNILFRDNTSQCVRLDPKEKNTGITIFYELTRSIFKDNSVGVRTQGQPVSINNNYFVGNETGIVSFYSYHEIQNNEFFMNEDGIVCTGATIEVVRNIFYDNRASVGIKFAYQAMLSNPIITQNNFIQHKGYAIKLEDARIKGDIDAANNYWSVADVDRMIFDVNDYSPIKYEVIYLPKASKSYEDAGIVR